jgi:hypothetical protein
MNKPVFHISVIRITVILFLAIFTFTGTGCRLLKHDKQAIAEKKQADSDKKYNEEYEKARKQHYKNQSKEAKAMMKRTKKESAKYNKPKKRKLFSGIKCK